jgi:hypothetical protein
MTRAGAVVSLLIALGTGACATGGPLTPEERALPLRLACDTVGLFDQSGLVTLAVCGASLLQQVGCRGDRP